MKRRAFIFSALIVTVTIPLVKYTLWDKWYNNPLLVPKELSRFCDDNILRKMGNRYLQIFPEENNKTKLNDILLTDYDGKKINSTDEFLILKSLNKKIYLEFSANQIIILNGWVISKTEARQCALFFLS